MLSAKNTNSTGNSGAVHWIVLIYFFSGVCSLIDEVVWVRLLKLTLGNTVYASSIVVSVFMGGLALGALIMAGWADRIKRPLRLYALLEFLITVSALSMPWALRAANNGYIVFFRRFAPAHWQLLIVQIVFSTALLLIPTMLMGSTLPLLGRFVTTMENKVGHMVGRLYALNMLGAATGCFLAGFVLLRTFGVMGTLYIAAGVNLFVAFGGWFLSLFPGASTQERDQEAKPVPIVAESKRIDAGFIVLIIAFFMSGLICIAYEIIWMRSIVHLAGGATYVFSAVLTVYLLGNVLGVGVGSRLSKRLKSPAIGFAVSLSLVGLAGVLYLPLLNLWAVKILPNIDLALGAGRTHRQYSSNIMFGPFWQCLCLFLLPSFLMGVGFPMALQAWARRVHLVGKSTGTAYGANTIGAVAGGMVAGFILIPLLGVQFSMALLGLSGVWIGFIMCQVFLGPSKIMWRLAYATFAVTVTVFAIASPSDLFDRIVTNKHPGLLAVKEGVTTTVSVHQIVDNYTYLCSSGQILAGDVPAMQSDQKMLAHFCMMLNSGAEEILSVGFGTGGTTLGLSKHHPKRIDCVEIAPEVVDISLEFYRHINLGDQLNEKVNMIYMDAKNYLNLTERRYDVIINDPIHPRTFAENASLYMIEYFQSAKDHLNPKGILVSWIPTYDMNPSVYRSIIGTLTEVFPHITLWFPTTNYTPLVLFVASEDQQIYSIEHITRLLSAEGVRDDMRFLNIDNAMDLFSCYIGDERDIRKHIKEFDLNSDYFPFVEFNSDDTVLDQEIFNPFVLALRNNTIYEHIDWTGYSEADRQKWTREYDHLYKAMGFLLKSYGAGNLLEKMQHHMNGLKLIPDNAALLYARNLAEKMLLSNCIELLRSGNPDNALEIANQMLLVNPESATAWIIRSLTALNNNQLQRALMAAKKAVELAPGDADTHRCLGRIYSSSAKIPQAIKEYEKAIQIEPGHVQVLNALAYLLSFNANAEYHDPVRAVHLAEKACQLTNYKKPAFVETLTRANAAMDALMTPHLQLK